MTVARRSEAAGEGGSRKPESSLMYLSPQGLGTCKAGAGGEKGAFHVAKAEEDPWEDLTDGDKKARVS